MRTSARLACVLTLMLLARGPRAVAQSAGDELYRWQTASAGCGFRDYVKYDKTGKSGVEVRYGGLCLEVLQREGAPLLRTAMFVRTPMDYGQRVAGKLYRPVSLGSIACDDGPGGGDPAVLNTWSATTLTYTQPGAQPADRAERMRVIVSRLVPAVAVTSLLPRIDLLAGPRDVELESLRLAVGNASGAKVLPLADGASADLLPDARWLLVWFGPASTLAEKLKQPVDIPLLIVLGDGARKLSFSKAKGLSVGFSGPAGLAILPLEGDRPADPKQSAGWTGELPATVVGRCQWWSEHLAEFPLGARERYACDAAADTVTVTGTVSYVRIRQGGQRLAPLPPMLLTARRGGFAVTIDGEPTDTGLFTFLGPVAGMTGTDTYRYSVKGLSRYVLERRVAGTGAVPPALRARLEAQLRTMIAAGHLAPWMPITGRALESYHHLLYSDPGETLTILSEAIGAVDDPALRKLMAAYIAGERKYLVGPAATPGTGQAATQGAGTPRLEDLAHLPPNEGSYRQFYEPDPEVQKQLIPREIKARNFHVLNRCLPVEQVYALSEMRLGPAATDTRTDWQAVDSAVLLPYLSRMDWASMGWFRPLLPADRWQGIPDMDQGIYYERKLDSLYGRGAVMDANTFLSAAIGYTRLALADGDAGRTALGWGLLARAAIFRCALGSHPGWLYDSKVASPVPVGREGEDGNTARQNLSQLMLLDQFGYDYGDHSAVEGFLAPFVLGSCQEAGRFLADHQRPQIGRVLRMVDAHMQDWYLARGAEELLSGMEPNHSSPRNSYQIFQAKAWVGGEKPERLAWFTGVPWLARGDLYYIAKLTEAIRAHRGDRWQARPIAD